MVSRSLVCSSVLLLLAVTATPAPADQTGMSDMHAQRRVGGKRCFIDHYHAGNSAGARSRSAAMKEAVVSWRSFTDFEYGSDWANWNKAAGKRANCSRSGDGWGCAIEALPCR